MNIIGHEEEFNRLKAMVSTNTLPHAVLFVGAEGIGKRQIAAELARISLCFNDGEEGCSCPSCKAFGEGSHPDFHLLVPTVKGKSSPMIRIDDIGELLQELSRLPLLSKSRIALIDDADLMNAAAANRLLKTLEEPVGDIKFFLIASKRSNILPTILSRTMPEAFRALPEETMVKILTERGETEETAKKAARLSFGSVKKAISLAKDGGLKALDDCAAFLKERLTYKKIFETAESMSQEGKDKISDFLSALTLILRDILLYREGAVPTFDYDKGLLAKCDAFFCFKLLALTREYEKRLGANVNLRLFVEGFLLKYKKLSGGI